MKGRDTGRVGGGKGKKRLGEVVVVGGRKKRKREREKGNGERTQCIHARELHQKLQGMSQGVEKKSKPYKK